MTEIEKIRIEIDKKIKLYESLIKESGNVQSIFLTAIKDFYAKLQSVTNFVSTMPNEMLYRKMNLTKLIKQTLLNVDNAMSEFKKIDFDSSMQVIKLKQQLQQLNFLGEDKK